MFGAKPAGLTSNVRQTSGVPTQRGMMDGNGLARALLVAQKEGLLPPQRQPTRIPPSVVQAKLKGGSAI